MRLAGFELRVVRLTLVAPFRTSFGVGTARDVLLVRAACDGGDGWGECVALGEPAYSPEYVDGAIEVTRRFLLPAVLAAGEVDAEAASLAMAGVKGHPMAKAAVETAVLDAQLRAAGTSLASHLGAVRDRVPVGVSVGIAASVDALVSTVARYVEEGYGRVKLKIEPGWDVEPVAAVRSALGDSLTLQVDANGAYTPADIEHLARLDAHDLLLVEQPFAEDDLLGHAELAKRLVTPVCLDESITSVRMAELALALGACSVVNVKPGRVGGYLEARRIHDLCLDRGVPVWCGGMLETGIGRAANLALAALPGFTLPGDISASRRYYTADVTRPFELDDGHIAVPQGPGIGVTPEPGLLDAVTVHTEWHGRERRD